MPELPEVETFRRFLQKSVAGATIETVSVFRDRSIRSPDAKSFSDRIQGQRIDRVERRGKLLIFVLERDVLLAHLRMEGRFLLREKGSDAVSADTMVLFKLLGENDLLFDDLRRFGTLDLVSLKGYQEHAICARLGLEPFSEKLTVAYLRECWKRRSAAIKVVLLEQSDIVGIGNIYASEILFAIRVSPFRPAKELTDSELKLLISEFRRIMEEAIAHKGTTIHTFSVAGSGGAFVDFLQVYGRAGAPCRVCKAPLRREKIRGRSSFFCDRCQRN